MKMTTTQPTGQYHSPFDELLDRGIYISSVWCKLHHHLEYCGDLADIFEGLSRITDAPIRSAWPHELFTLALHPPRMLRGLIDYKVVHGLPLAMMQEGIEVALAVYRQAESWRERVTELRRKTEGISGLLDFKFLQQDDLPSWNAYHPACSRSTLQQLVDAGLGNLLFIPLAHGGVPAGMDIYLRYCAELPKTDNGFYPVRFSTQKLNDKIPSLTTEEQEYLKEAGKNHTIIVFDEDVSSGYTLKCAKSFFQDFFQRDVLVMTNHDPNGLTAELNGSTSFLEWLKGFIAGIIK